ncbi:hypothetical protein XENTR_v10000910 [Xenopus tropicalis]|nr:hypothetical protein XENTR_v10000910 [Xenopus tropicalis]
MQSLLYKHSDLNSGLIVIHFKESHKHLKQLSSAFCRSILDLYIRVIWRGCITGKGLEIVERVQKIFRKSSPED